MSVPRHRTSIRRRKQGGSGNRFLSQRVLIVVFVIVALLALIVFIVRSDDRPPIANVTGADPTNMELVAMGQQVYATRCAGCHGANLEGEPDWPQRRSNGVMPASPLDASGQAWRHDDQWLFRTVKQGGQATAPPGYTSYMPAFGDGLTDEQIWAVLAYIKSTWPRHIQATQPQARVE